MFEFVKNGSKDTIGSSSRLFDGVIAILEDIRFDNRNYTSKLAFFGKASKKLGVFFDGDEAGLVFGDAEFGAPFSKTESVSISSAHAVKKSADAESVVFAGFRKFGETLIGFEAWDDTAISEIVNDVLTIDFLFGAFSV